MAHKPRCMKKSSCVCGPCRAVELELNNSAEKMLSRIDRWERMREEDSSYASVIGFECEVVTFLSETLSNMKRMATLMKILSSKVSIHIQTFSTFSKLLIIHHSSPEQNLSTDDSVEYIPPANSHAKVS